MEKVYWCPNCGKLRLNKVSYPQCPICGAALEEEEPKRKK